ncbi:PbsX family transcriptional regulator [Labrys okinawensis]|uniref:AbrB/MazE/SpoVT family DNA-binding domain-containing protein n=1 Tax=Labrys okinawensis TaxID=346911 RepID=UPI0039BCCDD1
MSDIVKLRQQGGAAIITVPAHYVRELALKVGADLQVDIVDGKLIVQPALPVKPSLPRRTLAELLVGSEHAAAVHEETRWAREGDPVGQEIL